MPSFSGRIDQGRILINVLVSIPIQDPDDPSLPDGQIAYRALVDTGATISGISKKVVKELGLIPDGWRPTTGVHGTKNTLTCSVALHVAVSESNAKGDTVHVRGSSKMSVTVLDFRPKDFDVILGMDMLMSYHLSMSNGMFILST